MPDVKHDPAQGVIIGTGRADIIRRVGNLMRGDWSMTYFDGRDVKRWLDGALDGDADKLRELDAELAGQEAD